MLWLVAALIAAAVTGASLIPHDTSRDRVARYINRANDTGAAFTKQYRNVSAAYRSLTLAPNAQAEQLGRLRLSASRLTALRIELQQIPAPPRAGRLRLRLIAFYRRQEQVAHELVGIMAYFPELRAAEQALTPAASRLHTLLATAKTPKGQGAVLAAYAEAIVGALHRIEGILPPPLLTAAHTAEVRRLDRTRRSIQGVRRALLAHSRVQLKRAVKSLGATSAAASVATRAAILAYNRHITEIRQLGAAVEQERQRLDRSLG